MNSTEPLTAIIFHQTEATMNENVLKKYPRAIFHMRAQHRKKQFGLVLGAGTSSQFGFPRWEELLDKIASTLPDLQEIDKSNSPSFAQCLFRSFLNQQIEKEGNSRDPLSPANIVRIKAEWTRLVKDKLYDNVPEEINELKEKCTYLDEFVEIIKKTRLTINYNFDDSIQRLLNDRRDETEKQETRGYRTDWRTDPQIYPQNAVIYHPNGYLPKHTGEKPSDSIVLLDDAFGDQLIESMAGKYIYLLNHYAQTTCLFVGLSLTDPTLQSILRRNAITHPGHVHYYLKRLKGSQATKTQGTIVEANFETYNLITLYLEESEFSELAKLILMEDGEFAELCERVAVPNRYIYYLVGCVAAGKSTTTSFFRSLSIHDEWIERMPKDMNKDPSLVNPESVTEIDDFVASQWKKKNQALKKSKYELLVVDRCHLDAFAFTHPEKWHEKAQFLYEKLSLADLNNSIEKGMVIFLKNEPRALHARAIIGLRETDEEKLASQQQLLYECYSSDKDCGFICIDTFGMSRNDVAKEVARIIHIKEYQEYDLQNRLNTLRERPNHDNTPEN